MTTRDAAEPTVQSLAEFLGRIFGLTPERFAARYPHPFLIEWRARAPGPEPFRGSQTTEPGVTLPGGAPPDAARIIQVRKTPSNAAFKHITVGRTGNNDIALGDAAISKLHAYFVAPEPGADDRRWRIVDMSSFGTSVNGERCIAEHPTPLLTAARDAAAPRVSFADVHFLFVEDAQAVLRTLAALQQRAAAR